MELAATKHEPTIALLLRTSPLIARHAHRVENTGTYHEWDAEATVDTCGCQSIEDPQHGTSANAAAEDVLVAHSG